ncbi:hypothetical protein SMD44_07981 [Streptomyces alboflavus]|uniref:Uncharacterized protein n=1 Tax=Streptomyces alboflavus TaxID=67267 RepID=A0A1Z1WQ03_9ACTN|nr:hypothetical protein [Streptomyces alboflavus]ARX88494.1 hypothetical protein SMD44_07981 [Streptomyces alboflavus]
MTVMAGQVWVSLISLGGVVLGGVLSYLVQHRTQQSADRAEQQRQRLSLSETRRAERLALLERFIDLNRTVWHGLPDGGSVRDYLEGNRSAFLAAREVMG